MELYKKSATELKNMLEAKECTSREIVDSFLSRIEATEPTIDAFITVTADQARDKADKIDKKRASGDKIGKYAGIPVALKDNICTNGVRTTCASKMLENFVPPYNATVVDKLEQEGLISLGKLNLDEFAMGSSTETSFFKTSKNPWDTSRVPGGSSGGSGAAVATGQVPFALGTDTGGSIRLPAAFCGTVGLKPTYGSVSRYGVTAFSSSLDQVGPMGRTVSDVAALYDVIRGVDEKDVTSLSSPFDSSFSQFDKDIKGLTIGVPKEYYTTVLNSEIRESVEKALSLLEEQGAIIKEVSLPTTKHALSAYYIISSAEASSNLARFDGVRYGFRAQGITSIEDLYDVTRSQGFGDEVQLRIMLGNYVLSAANYDTYFRRAVALRERVSAELATMFESCDLLITPTYFTTARPIGQATDSKTSTYKADTSTVTANLAGIPALSIPTGLDSNGLPMSMQLLGAHFSEPTLLGVAKIYESLVGGFSVIPELQGGA